MFGIQATMMAVVSSYLIYVQHYYITHGASIA